jgi:hypothetical protein
MPSKYGQYTSTLIRKSVILDLVKVLFLSRYKCHFRPGQNQIVSNLSELIEKIINF